METRTRSVNRPHRGAQEPAEAAVEGECIACPARGGPRPHSGGPEVVTLSWPRLRPSAVSGVLGRDLADAGLRGSHSVENRKNATLRRKNLWNGTKADLSRLAANPRRSRRASRAPGKQVLICCPCLKARRGLQRPGHYCIPDPGKDPWLRMKAREALEISRLPRGRRSGGNVSPPGEPGRETANR